MPAADLVARRVVRPMAWLVVAAALAAGCATSSALRDGRTAERADDYDRAVVEYTKALKEDPDNFDARQALDRAKLRAAELHFARGRRLYATGKFEEALVEMQLASELNPGNGEIDAELRRTRVGPAHQARHARSTARRASSRSSSARATCSRRDSSCRAT